MIGSRLRQYVIAHKIGEGGMGVVWKARDTTLERDVALKILPANLADDEVRRERFLREARAASALNHPNIVTVYEINADGDTAFIAMELVDGETLSARLARGPMPIDEVLRLARQMAEAVARAHRAGIVHRDLKPGNVMINHDGLVKVLDFGLAKVGANASPDERTGEETRLALTRDGTALGTMGYMSPEQAIGDAADARSDVFTFGVILYQMLAGVLPFEGQTNTELLRALHFGEPKPLAAVRPETPAWLAGIVMKAMAKEPGNRFPSMGEVAAALNDATPVSAPPSRRPGRRRERASREGLQTALWVGVSLVFVAIYAVPWDDIFRREAEERPSAGAADTSPSKLTLDAAALLERYDRSGNVDRATEMLQRAIAADPEYATAYAHLALAYLTRYVTTPDAQWMTLARVNADRAVELNADLALAHAVLGAVHQDGGREEDARAAYERALTLDPLNTVALRGVAKGHDAANREDQARATFEQVIATDPTEWRAFLELGAFHYRRGRYADAATALERARTLAPDSVPVLTNLGAAYYMGGRPDEAASLLQEALAIRPTGPIYTNLANIRFFQGRYAEAVDAFEKAVKLNANNSLVWGNLGDAYRWAPGRRGEAPDAYRRAIQLIDSQLAKKPADANLRTQRAGFLAKMGDTRAAVEELAGLPPASPLTPQMLVRITTVYELAGDRARALDAVGRALKGGFPPRELAADPELIDLRADARYHRLVSSR